jgi:hypothetical protein
MKRERPDIPDWFRVSIGNDRSQGAVMVLAKGGCEGGPDNRPRILAGAFAGFSVFADASDCGLFLVSGVR